MKTSTGSRKEAAVSDACTQTPEQMNMPHSGCLWGSGSADVMCCTRCCWLRRRDTERGTGGGERGHLNQLFSHCEWAECMGTTASLPSRLLQQLWFCLLGDAVAVVQLLLPAFLDKLDLRHISAFTRLRSVSSASEIIPHSRESKLNLQTRSGCCVFALLQHIPFGHCNSCLLTPFFFLKERVTAVYCVLSCQTEYQPVHPAATEARLMMRLQTNQDPAVITGLEYKRC